MLFFLKRNIPLTNAFLDAVWVELVEIMETVDQSPSVEWKQRTKWTPV